MDKYRTLVERLLKRTLNGDLSWDYDEFENKLSTNIAERMVYLEETKNDNGEPAIKLSIVNPTSQKAESFIDDMINGPTPNYRGFDSYWVLMKTLFDVGVRRATGADKDIDDILDTLDDVPF
ncbi:hypothetical protein [Sphingobium tyrosinilyticum]|uniref:Uncharacterized protein n=1 Tax=Sphingobium tyrosinilyticum TaxID=2715436 RepID=A0ABV9EV76_9SPHN